MSAITAADTVRIQSILNNITESLTAVMAMTKAANDQLVALNEHNDSETSHTPILNDIVCIGEQVTALSPTIHPNGSYSGPVVLKLNLDGRIDDVGYITPSTVE